MNIFVVNENPVAAARQLCNRHIIKMPLESAQMLCAALHAHGHTDTIYKPTHKNHPCTKWAGETRNNFIWLVEHGMELCREYTRRYGKTHKCEAVIESCMADVEMIPAGHRTPFIQAMGETYKHTNPIIAYQRYLTFGKQYMNKGQGPQWKSTPPDWFKPHGA
jgi:hypothetical protein|tara:strand:- start:86 stop:574 length:489 start_codon:yes stop_codon:yes gene_type:complete